MNESSLVRAGVVWAGNSVATDTADALDNRTRYASSNTPLAMYRGSKDGAARPRRPPTPPSNSHCSAEATGPLRAATRRGPAQSLVPPAQSQWYSPPKAWYSLVLPGTAWYSRDYSFWPASGHAGLRPVFNGQAELRHRTRRSFCSGMRCRPACSYGTK